MRNLRLWCSAALMSALGIGVSPAQVQPARTQMAGLASWYGEAHRGWRMANGRRFDPDRFTAASWFYPLGTKVRVTLNSGAPPVDSLVVTITDRGPARSLVRRGRVIDLSHAAFRALSDPGLGLIGVKLEPLN